MKTFILATIAKYPTNDYPFAVQIVFGDDQKELTKHWPNNRSQELGCRSLRDCLMVGNGMGAALMAMGVRLSDANVMFDDRLARG